MRTGPTLVGVAVAAVGLGVSVWAGPNVALAAPAAAVACLAVVAVAVAAFSGRTAPLPATEPEPEVDTLVILRSSFEAGELGRHTILSTLSGLELQAYGEAYRGLPLDEEERLTRASPAEFRRWLGARLDRLEQRS